MYLSFPQQYQLEQLSPFGTGPFVHMRAPLSGAMMHRVTNGEFLTFPPHLFLVAPFKPFFSQLWPANQVKASGRVYDGT